MDDYNSNASRQTRFTEIQHQILSPFTAFIGIETRTVQDIATSDEMVLGEVPMEMSDNRSLSIDSAASIQQNSYNNSDSESTEFISYTSRQSLRRPEQCKISRSRSPKQHDVNNENFSGEQSKCDNSLSDIIRQIIDLQNFNGLWSINDRKQIIALLQQSIVTAVLKDVDLEKILNDYKTKHNDVTLCLSLQNILLMMNHCGNLQ